ncbi:MAG: hypothetical protein ABID04_02740, partial [Patescibacteria group bacterium]
PEGRRLLRKKVWKGLLSDPLLVQVMDFYQKLLSKKKKIPYPQKFFASLPTELQQGFGEIYLNAGRIDLEPDKLAKEAQKTVEFLRELVLRQRLEELSGQIAKREQAGSKKSFSKLEKEFVLLSQKLADLSVA